MRQRTLTWMGAAAVLAVTAPASFAGQASTSARPAASQAASAQKTSWGEPDLQGIWTRGVPGPAAAAREVRGEGVLHRRRNQRAAGQGACGPAGFGDVGLAPKGTEAGSRRRLQRGLHLVAAHGPAHVADRRSAGRAHSSAHAGGAAAAERRWSRISARAAAVHGHVQEQAGRLRRRELRAAVAEAAGAASVLRGGQRGPGRRGRVINRSDGPEDRGLSERCMTAILPDFSAAFRQIVQSPGIGLDLLRHGPGTRVAPRHPGRRQPAPARRRPPVVGRLARPLGRQHAGRRRHEFQPARPTSGDRARTCIWSSAGRASARTRSSTSSRSRIRRRGRSRGRSSRS